MRIQRQDAPIEINVPERIKERTDVTKISLKSPIYRTHHSNQKLQISQSATFDSNR
jgi:hypothetical protein